MRVHTVIWAYSPEPRHHSVSPSPSLVSFVLNVSSLILSCHMWTHDFMCVRKKYRSTNERKHATCNIYLPETYNSPNMNCSFHQFPYNFIFLYGWRKLHVCLSTPHLHLFLRWWVPGLVLCLSNCEQYSNKQTSLWCADWSPLTKYPGAALGGHMGELLLALCGAPC